MFTFRDAESHSTALGAGEFIMTESAVRYEARLSYADS
jgi:hypothetical protein